MVHSGMGSADQPAQRDRGCKSRDKMKQRSEGFCLRCEHASLPLTAVEHFKINFFYYQAKFLGQHFIQIGYILVA